MWASPIGEDALWGGKKGHKEAGEKTRRRLLERQSARVGRGGQGTCIYNTDLAFPGTSPIPGHQARSAEKMVERVDLGALWEQILLDVGAAESESESGND